jgi:hypothetical protein
MEDVMKIKAFWPAVIAVFGTVVIAVAGVQPASAATSSINGQTVDFGTQVLYLEAGAITVSVTLDPGMTLLGASEDPGPGHTYIQADIEEDNGSCVGAVGPVTCQIAIRYFGRTVGPTSDSGTLLECPATRAGDCPQIGTFIMTGYGVQGPVATTTAVALSPSAPVAGQATRFTATVKPDVGTGTATGSVRFQLDGLNLGSGVTMDGSGHAVSPVATLSAGPHSLTATFSPTNPFDALSASSRTVSFTVLKMPTTLTAKPLVVTSLNLRVAGTLLGVAGVPVQGRTIRFTTASNAPICSAQTDTSGTAACYPSLTQDVAVLVAGRYAANFDGDATYLAASSEASASLI